MRVHSLSQEQAAANQPIKRTVSNLLRTQQFNSKLRIPSAKRHMIFLNVRKKRLDWEAKESCDTLPGGTGAQNTSNRSQQVDNETEEDSAPALRGVSYVLETYNNIILNICHIPRRDATTKRSTKSTTQWLL